MDQALKNCIDRTLQAIQDQGTDVTEGTVERVTKTCDDDAKKQGDLFVQAWT